MIVFLRDPKDPTRILERPIISYSRDARTVTILMPKDRTLTPDDINKIPVEELYDTFEREPVSFSLDDVYLSKRHLLELTGDHHDQQYRNGYRQAQRDICNALGLSGVVQEIGW